MHIIYIIVLYLLYKSQLKGQLVIIGPYGLWPLHVDRVQVMKEGHTKS